MIEVGDVERASIDGLALDEGEEIQVKASVVWKDDAAPVESRRVRFMQFSTGADAPDGGVTYDVLPPEK